MAKVTVSFSLDDRADRDIISWLDKLPKGQKSPAIREALRGHLRGRGVTLADIYQAVLELDRKLAAGAVLATSAGVVGAGASDEPADLAAALNDLGL